MARLESEVRALPEAELDGTLAGRLDLPHSVDAQALEQALSHVEERSRSNQESFTGAPDISHAPRPKERKGAGDQDYMW